MSSDALLVSCRKQHWPWHKVTTVDFYQHASVSLHCSSDFNPLTHNEVYCDMIALQYIEENCMNAVHSGHTQTLMLAIPPYEGTRPHTRPHTVFRCCVKQWRRVWWMKEAVTEIHLWLTWMSDCDTLTHTDSLVHLSRRTWASGNLLSLASDSYYVGVFRKYGIFLRNLANWKCQTHIWLSSQLFLSQRLFDSPWL